ncbi:hypothetical protein I5S53_08445 [Pseudomonas juntendi]|uniref:P-loop NTPase fold protein n=1 Tax=Pseudomonas TaxID=286 RepID=UPI0007DBF360|nr:MULTISPECIES: P-loop NTPase fold protein [Pseudomonas]MBH3384001.1 hypothetical protein [Pseudomonas juntendi]OAS08541.1 hypothetical protein AYO08_08170 [Pseudomonas putida]PYC04914.1 hypothetical protein DMX12_08555 [Pseudomonas sp. MB-090624]
MTIERCKHNLLLTLASQDNRVIALTGKWGTGKTHLWQQVRDTSVDETIKKAAAISLFGVSSVNDLKTKVAYALMPRLVDKGVATQITEAFEGLTKLAKGLHRSFNAMDNLPLVILPTLLKNKFLVIDDIERKHDKLHIDEILGFIDECVQVHKCRVLLVLNDDKLTDKKIWEQFREKVIDQELRLDTSPAEAFGIAKGIIKTEWEEALEKATVTCGVTNIRILCKIIRVANRLLEGHGPLPAEVIEKVIPSVVLLSTIHFKSLPDGPTFEYLLDYNGTVSATLRAIRARQGDQDESEDDAQHAQWDSLLSDLGIYSCGEFEKLVVEVLRTGLLDTQAVQDLVERYRHDSRLLISGKGVAQFIQHYNWYPELTTEQLVAELRSLVPGAEFIEPPTLSYLMDLSEELTGGPELSEEFLSSWSTALDAAHPDGLVPPQWPSTRPIRPEVEAVLNAAYARLSSTTTLAEACSHIRKTQGWGDAEEHLLKHIKATEYQAEISKANGRNLEMIFNQSMQFVLHKAAYQDFGDVGDRFVKACRSILRAEPSSRLSGIIRKFFEYHNQAGLL